MFKKKKKKSIVDLSMVREVTEQSMDFNPNDETSNQVDQIQEQTKRSNHRLLVEPTEQDEEMT